jgi:hypothetical protein
MSLLSAALGATAGIVGGLVLGRKVPLPRKLLGLPIPGGGPASDDVPDPLAEAARQFSSLMNEVRAVRDRAEKATKARV